MLCRRPGFAPLTPCWMPGCSSARPRQQAYAPQSSGGSEQRAWWASLAALPRARLSRSLSRLRCCGPSPPSQAPRGARPAERHHGCSMQRTTRVSCPQRREPVPHAHHVTHHISSRALSLQFVAALLLWPFSAQPGSLWGATGRASPWLQHAAHYQSALLSENLKLRPKFPPAACRRRPPCCCGPSPLSQAPRGAQPAERHHGRSMQRTIQASYSQRREQDVH